MYEIDDVKYTLKENFDFSFLKQYGRVFKVFDQQDSGNICFGLENDNRKVFVKVAGASTIHYQGSTKKAIEVLKSCRDIYKDLEHESLIRLLDDHDLNHGYALVFEWVEGACLHAHWDFHKYKKGIHKESPNYQFNQLPLEDRLKAFEDILKFHIHVAQKDYISVDFYDGSLIYNFSERRVMIGDIDFYHKGSFVNEQGDMWGSKRFKSPEEMEVRGVIDELTMVYTMGATAFELLGDSSRKEDSWMASKALFDVAKKATSKSKNNRFSSLSEMLLSFQEAL